MAKISSAGELPDDLLLDIFARVATESLDLLRCAGTCIRWFRLIADTAFLRRAGALPKNAQRASLLIGAFYQEANLICPCKPEKVFERNQPPRFAMLYTPPRPTGVASCLGFASLLPNTDGVFDYAEPLTSRRGLLLLRLMPRPIDPRKLHLAVCHPLIGEQATRLLPPAPLDLNPELFGGEVTGYALFTSADHPNGSDLDNENQPPRKPPTFRVILTAVHSDDQLVHVYSYSSATGSWSPPIKCPQTYGLTRSGQRDGVVIRGTVHWVYRDEGCLLCTLDVSAYTAHISLTKTPILVQACRRMQRGSVIAYAAGGKLSTVLAALRDGAPEFWTLGEQDNVKQQRQVDLGCGGQRPELLPKGVRILAFAESKGAMLLQHEDGSGLFTLDLQSTEMEPVILKGEDSKWWGCVRFCSSFNRQKNGTCNNFRYNYHVLYEMDWPSYLHHLSIQPC